MQGAVIVGCHQVSARAGEAWHGDIILLCADYNLIVAGGDGTGTDGGGPYSCCRGSGTKSSHIRPAGERTSAEREGIGIEAFSTCTETNGGDVSAIGHSARAEGKGIEAIGQGIGANGDTIFGCGVSSETNGEGAFALGFGEDADGGRPISRGIGFGSEGCRAECCICSAVRSNGSVKGTFGLSIGAIAG